MSRHIGDGIFRKPNPTREKFTFSNVNFLSTVPNYGPVYNNTGKRLYPDKIVNKCLTSTGVPSGTVVIQIGSTAGGSQYGQLTFTSAAQISANKFGQAFATLNGYDPIEPGAEIYLRVSTAGGGSSALTGDITLYASEID